LKIKKSYTNVKRTLLQGFSLLTTGMPAIHANSVLRSHWIIVKAPDGKGRISIALLVDQEKGAKPLYQELQEIIRYFFRGMGWDKNI